MSDGVSIAIIFVQMVITETYYRNLYVFFLSSVLLPGKKQ